MEGIGTSSRASGGSGRWGEERRGGEDAAGGPGNLRARRHMARGRRGPVRPRPRRPRREGSWAADAAAEPAPGAWGLREDAPRGARVPTSPLAQGKPTFWTLCHDVRRELTGLEPRRLVSQVPSRTGVPFRGN